MALQLQNLVPLKTFVQRHNWIGMSTLRKLIREQRKNGFEVCVHKISDGRTSRYLLDESAVAAWFEERQKKRMSEPKKYHYNRRKPKPACTKKSKAKPRAKRLADTAD